MATQAAPTTLLRPRVMYPIPDTSQQRSRLMGGLEEVRGLRLRSRRSGTPAGEIRYQPSAVFVGQTAPSGAAVAVVLGTSSSQATLYVCDGVSASAWFHGTSSGNAVTATTDEGAKADLTVAGDRATRTVEVAGQGVVNFTAERASGWSIWSKIKTVMFGVDCTFFHSKAPPPDPSFPCHHLVPDIGMAASESRLLVLRIRRMQVDAVSLQHSPQRGAGYAESAGGAAEVALLAGQDLARHLGVQ